MKGFGKLIKENIGWVILVSILGLAANILALYVPKLSAVVIDSPDTTGSLTLLLVVAVVTLIVAAIQVYVSTYLSEKVGRDLREKLIDTISRQTYSYINTSTPGRLLTVTTSDVDAVKNVIAQGLVTLLGALVTLIGTAVILVMTDMNLGLLTLSVVPLLILCFVLVFGKIATAFRHAQENLEKINAITSETIIGAPLVRVLNAAAKEIQKFDVVNTRAKDIGLSIVRNISALIPMIMFLANAATIIIVWFGGLQVIDGTLSIGNFSAFLQYTMMFVWPLFVLSFVGTMISRGGVSLVRINEVLDAPIAEQKGNFEGTIRGDIEFRNVSLRFVDESNTERTVLKDISFTIKAGTKNAIVGPTAAGKTQLFYLMSGLALPSEGEIFVDGRAITEYKSEALLSQIGLVFQDSIIFNSSLRENVALSGKTEEKDITQAMRAAELDGLVASLPKGLETNVSERGMSLSGGQKQRLMLARALAINPKILLLDDFTARVDQQTEASILGNVEKEYAGVTLVSITQKVEPIKNYDSIFVLMEGELVGCGTHDELLRESFEYKQIYESQKSTETIHTS